MYGNHATSCMCPLLCTLLGKYIWCDAFVENIDLPLKGKFHSGNQIVRSGLKNLSSNESAHIINLIYT